MKALTIHQPWASLVAVGAKRIETRSWSTSYRGPLAIHAGKRPITEADVKDWNGYDYSQWGHQPRDTSTLIKSHVGRIGALPLGAVVASARLVDVVPMVPPEPVPWDQGRVLVVQPNGPDWLQLWDTDGRLDLVSIHPDERPFGDFSPGRFAWILDDVARVEDRCPWCWGTRCSCQHRNPDLSESTHALHDVCPVCGGAGKCDPIPARGRQGLWEWEVSR